MKINAAGIISASETQLEFQLSLKLLMIKRDDKFKLQLAVEG